MTSFQSYVGTYIALWGPLGKAGEGSWIQMRHKGKLAYLTDSDATKENLESWRTWERFLVVSSGSESGSGSVSLYSPEHKYFITVDAAAEQTMTVSATDAPSPDSTFDPITYPNGVNMYSFKVRNSQLHSFLRVGDDTVFEVHIHPPLEMKPCYGNLPEHLVNQIRAGNVIAFIGAGFTAPAGLPTWPGLIEAVAKRLPGTCRPSLVNEIINLVKRASADSLDQAAQMLEDELGAQLFSSYIAEILKPKDLLPQQMLNRLRLLKNIPFKAVLTTNVDTVIEGGVSNFHPDATAIREEILRGPAKKFTEQLKFCSSESLGVPVLQLHGSVTDPKHMVFTRKGYRDLLHGSESYLNFIRSVMSSYTIFSLSRIII